MSDDQIIHSLKTKRAEMALQVLELEEKLNEARAYIGHIDGTLRLYGLVPPPKAPTKRGGLRFERNELARFVMHRLQGRPGGLTDRAMSEALMGEKGWDTSDDRLLQALIHRMGNALYKLRRRGFVESYVEGTIGVWRLAER
jgi:hypothetical protein